MEQNNTPSPPATDDVQRVEVETETDDARNGRAGQAGPNAGRSFTFRFGRVGAPGGFQSFFSGNAGNPGDPNNPGMPGKPPAVAAWICLVLAWLFLGSSLPFTVFLGVPLALVSIFLGLACLSRGGVFTGFAVMLLGSIGSFVVYLVGLFRFLAG